MELQVFAIGSDGCLGHVWQSAAADGAVKWSDWDSFGIPIRSAPRAVRNFDDCIDVFAAGSDGCLGHVRQWDPAGHAWSGWVAFGPPISDGPLAICPWGVRPKKPYARPCRRRRRTGTPHARPESGDDADVCVIGAGPAGIVLSERLVRAGARVVLLESGTLDWHTATQELNHGACSGQIIKDHWRYLSEGRGRQVGGTAGSLGTLWCMAFRARGLREPALGGPQRLAAFTGGPVRLRGDGGGELRVRAVRGAHARRPARAPRLPLSTKPSGVPGDVRGAAEQRAVPCGAGSHGRRAQRRRRAHPVSPLCGAERGRGRGTKPTRWCSRPGGSRTLACCCSTRRCCRTRAR